MVLTGQKTEPLDLPQNSPYHNRRQVTEPVESVTRSDCIGTCSEAVTARRGVPSEIISAGHKNEPIASHLEDSHNPALACVWVMAAIGKLESAPILRTSSERLWVKLVRCYPFA